MHHYKIFFVMLLCWSLTGCFKPNEPSPKLSLQARTQYLNKMQHWKITSRVGMRDAQQGHNVSMDWEQNHNTYTVRFYSPIVSDQATIKGRPGQVMLETGDGKKYTSTSAEQLLLEHMGWHVPFTRMTYWIKGQPVPEIRTTSVKYDRYNQLQMLQQDGWTIEYQQYMVQDGMSLPEKIVLTNHQLYIKIVINQFTKV